MNDIDTRELLISFALSLAAALVTGLGIGFAAFIELPWSW